MIKQFINQMDLSKNLHSYSFTGQNHLAMERLVSSKELEELDTASIVTYLLEQMNLVDFRDHLRRYLYFKAEIGMPYAEVTDDVYHEIICESFREHNTPCSMGSTTLKISQAARKWLSQKTVRRETVFLLGFGLGMSAEDVSDFLIKGIQEEDFNQADPFEMACRNALKDGKSWSEMLNETTLPAVISHNGNEDTRKVWNKLLSETLDVIADYYDKFGDDSERKRKPSVNDIERILCSGLPLSSHGNLVHSKTKIAEFMEPLRMSRQRISLLENGKIPIGRHDLLGILFLKVALESQMREYPPVNFVDAANEMLGKCHMGCFYPVNPAESVLLLCLLTENPLDMLNSLWEESVT